jgi:glycerol kinase
MPGFILTIDQGTTNTKALLVDHTGQPVFRASRSVPLLTYPGGRIEQDLEDIWLSVVDVIHQCIEHTGANSIEAIALTNQRETAAAWDRITGTPVANAISWQCRRSFTICDTLAGSSALIQQRTGLPLDPLLSATKWAWLLEDEVALRHLADAGELCFGTIDSWLLWKLTSGKIHATDHTNASRTALLNLESLDWDPALLAIFGIPRVALPELVSSCGVLGEIVAIPQLLGVPIVSVIGDSHAALAGHGSFSVGAVKATYGTGSSLMTLTPTLPVAASQLARTIAWTIASVPQYALEGNITMTGSAIQWVGEFLGLADPVADTIALATSVSSAEGVSFVPAMAGLGAPYWNSAARGTISGLNRSSSRAHLARAALEAIAFQVADVFTAMQAASTAPMSALFADGGATRNDVLMQMQADVLGLPTHRAGCEDLSALGAAWLGGHALGWWPALADIVALRTPTTNFQPQPFDHHRYDQWKLAVARTQLKEANA